MMEFAPRSLFPKTYGPVTHASMRRSRQTAEAPHSVIVADVV